MNNETTMVYVDVYLVYDVESYNDSTNNENNNGLRRLSPSMWCKKLQWFNGQ